LGFLIDVSGSMDEPNKLPLLQRSLSALVENLSGEDRVAMVTYAGSSGLVLAPTEGAKKREILEAISNLRAGGSTHGSEGIRLAYETAREQFREDGNNRVILCTDGDFNVGVTNESELQKLIEKERESGVFLSVLGFGTGNLNDSTMELLADKGNGNYAYIDSISEGRKVLVEQMGSTLFTIAKDVKIQVEFNPARVAGYRLIGYENRLLAKEDFNDDKKDAGEIGAGHTVTALYEIIPLGQAVPGSPSVDPLKYQRPEQDANAASTSNELLTVKLRYKAPDGDKSKLIEIPLTADDIPDFDAASEGFRFASAVAAFGMKLRNSPDAGEISWPEIQDIVRGALGQDPGSYRAEFLTLIEKAKALAAARSDAASAPGTYKVAEGDNLYKIAKKLGVTSQELLKANNIEDPTKLQIGQVLKVPGKAN
jgi:Ca-activated chloride channel family protein